MVTVIPQVLAPEPAERPDAGARVDQSAQDRPVAEAEYILDLDGGQKLPGLLDRHLGGPALAGSVPDPPHGLEGVDDRGMSSDQGVEEVTQSGQGLVLGGRAAGEFVDKPAGQPGRHLVELQPRVLAPGEEPTHVAGVGFAGVRVRDPCPKELVRRKTGGPPSPDKNRRESLPAHLLLQRGRDCQDEIRVAHYGME